MNLIRKTYDTTEVQITSFQSSKGITEYHIFFQQTNCLERSEERRVGKECTG